MNQDLSRTDPGALAELLSCRPGSQRLWRPEELAAVFKHQMATAVQFDLASMEPGEACRLSALAASEGLLIKSFADLFRHPHPPIELLVMAKQFAKACIEHPESPLPDEVARVLYYASILIARARCGQRITSLDDHSVQEGARWILSLSWVDKATTTIIAEAAASLNTATGI